MAAVDFFSAFQYKWAQTGTVFAWDDAQYKLGWATIGSTPPSVEQFNRAQQVLDEKSNWLYGQLATVAAARGVTLTGASLTGLQQVLAAYGQATTTSTTPGAWMQVGAFGLGSAAPHASSYGYPSDFNLMDAVTGKVTVIGSNINGPGGAASLGYTGVLSVSLRGGPGGLSIVQEWSGYPTDTNGPGRWIRYGTGAAGARTYTDWEGVYTSRSIPAASTTVSGISRLATTAEATAGALATVAVTPAGLAAAVPAASTTVVGKTRLATTAEAIAGSLATVAVTPAGLAAAVPVASTTVVGKSRLATLAETATGTDGTLSITPAGLNSLFVGSIQIFAMPTTPAGWLKANGAAVSRTTYAALFSKIGTTFGTGDGSTTFNLPDLRGEFLRGWDDGRGIDASRVFGSAQLDAQQAFTGNLGLRRLNDGNSLVGNSGVTGGFQFTAGARGPSPRLISATDSATLSDDQVTFSNTAAGTRTATETRARNVALLVCIKY